VPIHALEEPQFTKAKESTAEQIQIQRNDDLFFDIRGIVHVHWMPEVQTVNHVYYKEVFTNLREWVRRRHEMWKNSSWVLHQENAPAQNTLSVKMFLTKHKITLLEHPSYSPDLAQCDFFYFQREVCVIRNQVQVLRCHEGKSDGAHESEDDLQHCFQQWKIHMEWFRERGGECIECDNISIV